MAKGIKKIEWTEKEKIVSNRSTANVKATIEADQFVHFKITEWYDGTTVEEKKGNVLWHFQTHTPRGSVIKTTKKSSETYGIKLPKKLCGIFPYYLQTSLPNVTYSKSAGLAIVGWCEPRIISSAWATKTNGEDVRLSHNFNFGNPVYLHLATEGLNGYNDVIIEIHRRVKGGKGIEDDQLIKVYTKAPVINGEVNVVFTDTLSWYGVIKDKIEIEEFYIKVKSPSLKKYIKDNNNDIYHARYLRIKNKKEHIIPKVETGLSKLKVGELDKYLKKAGHCRFKEISIYEKDDPFIMFNEGKFIRKLNPKDKSIVTERIYYDYDKWDIREDAKPILEKIAKFLLEPPRLPVELGSHTDIRGTDQYNMELSEKRAKSVVDYLIKKGVDPINISAKGYGKSKLINHGDHISEALHQQNRRTTLKFKIFENDAQALVYDVIVPSYKLPKKIKIQINGFTRKGCVKKADHKDQITIVDSYLEKKVNSLKEGNNSVSHSIHSITPSIPQLLEAFLYERGQIFYRFYLHSCAYYSIAKPEHPTFIINAYPDVNWVMHCFYDYKDKIYFKDIPVKLVEGIRFLNKVEQEIRAGIAHIPFISGEKEEALGSIMDTFHDFHNKVAVGMHALHDFSDPKTPTQRIDYTEEYRWMAEVYIAEVLIAEILIELLILWLTKGKGSFGRLRKYRKAARVIKKADELGFELVMPSVAIYSGYYFEKQKDKRIAKIFQARVKAYPLLGIKYSKEHKLADLHRDSADNEGSGKLYDTYGLKATLLLDFKGTINADYSATFNSLTKAISIWDYTKNALQNSKGTFTANEAIAVFAELKVNGMVEKTITWIPFVPPQHIKVEVDVKASLGGYVSLSREYGIQDREVYHQDTIEFSGLSGEIMVKAKVTQGEDDLVDYNPTNKTEPFTMFRGKTIKLPKVVAFNF